MFQYAMGRTLAIKNKVNLKLDLSFFRNYEWHEYSLEPFNIQKNYASENDLQSLGVKNGVVNKIARKLNLSSSRIVQEDTFLFDQKYLNIQAPAYLVGYWQSEKYFSSEMETIRREFEVTIPPSERNKDLLQEIAKCNSISLHIRRGNFASVGFVNKIHGTCSIDYYSDAVNAISKHCSDPVFFIFSDDISWARKHLKIPFKHFFVNNNDGKSDYEDLRLMYSCKHHIIANSTFSWWGAWLNKNMHKVVIAPKQWFADKEKNKMGSSIIPASWVRL